MRAEGEQDDRGEPRDAGIGPALAVGHVELYVRHVAGTSAFGVRLGARPIVDDIEAAWKLCEELGVRASSVKGDSIHSWFHITEPSGLRLTILASHAGQRRV